MHRLYQKANELSKAVIEAAIDDCLIVEAKSVEPCDLQRFRMQLLSYMKLLDVPLGLVINFGESTLGGRAIRRVILKGADAPDGTASF